MQKKISVMIEKKISVMEEKCKRKQQYVLTKAIESSIDKFVKVQTFKHSLNIMIKKKIVIEKTPEGKSKQKKKYWGCRFALQNEK